MKSAWQALLVAVTLALVDYTVGIAVMSIDLGSESLKIGIVSPGVPMEIVLNKESKRKTPAVVSFRDGIRTFGEEAQTVAIKYPQNSYSYLLDLLGKDINHPVVKLYQEQFPQYIITEDAQRGTIVFKHDEDTYYSVEELIAQLLGVAKEYAEISSKQPIKECVLTVPGFFNQAERKALLQAAKLANLNVLQLINDYTAVALNYGIFRVKDFNETAQYLMFIDIGASSTTVAIVSYQTIKTKERGFLETHPQLTVLGVGFDRTLGGRSIQLKLRDYLATKFNELKKTPNDVFKNPRSMAKLYKEAGRLKNVLSANLDHFAQIEGLLDDIDFKLQVTREDLENMCGDFFDRVGAPVEQALKAAGLSADLLNQVVLFGASTRIPKVQEILRNIVGQDLAKNLNTDEAAALGAVYKAADLSSGFQVKKFITKDAVIFPLQVVFQRESEGLLKQVKRTLFGPMNPYPQRKIITFNKHTTDFSFNVNYAELDYLPEREILNVGSLNLTEISLVGIPDAFSKHVGENSESKGIKAHFAIDDSGILKFVNAELVVEKTVLPEEELEPEGTLSKLGSTISKLFTGDSTPPENPAQEETTPENILKETEEPKTGNETSNDTQPEPPKERKPVLVTHKEPLQIVEKILYIDQLSTEQFEESVQKLKKLADIDREINRRATALNGLESFVIEAQTRLDESEYAETATEEESEKIRTACGSVSEWLYEDGADADAETYETKLNELKLITRDFYSRIFEHKERPEAINALNSILAGSVNFLETAKNLTKGSNSEKEIFTEVEIDMLQKVINETVAWRDEKIEEQNSLKKSEPVILTVKLISEKMAILDREVKYLVNKLKLWRPKKPETPKVEENITEKVDESTTPSDESKPKDEEKEDIVIEVTNEESLATEESKAEKDDTIEPSKTDSDTHTEL